jgi:hypothetical protein
MIEALFYSPDGEAGNKSTWKYDNRGNMIEALLYNSDGEAGKKMIFKYDDRCNIIEETTYNSDGSIYEAWNYKYEFDKQGNWIKRIEYISIIPKYIVERGIEYY